MIKYKKIPGGTYQRYENGQLVEEFSVENGYELELQLSLVAALSSLPFLK